MGERHGHRSHAVPFILAARMEIDVRLSQDDGHRLGPGRPHGHQFSTQRFRDGDRFGRRAGAADHHAQPVGRGRNGPQTVGTQHRAAFQPRQGDRAQHRPPADGKAHMHGPVGPRFPIFAGAIHRIDDPDPVLGQAFRIVPFFLRQQSVVGSGFAQGMAQELIGGLIACLAQRLRAEHAGIADFDQYAPGGAGEVRGQVAVGQHLRLCTHGISLATIASAASSGVMEVVSMRISGSSGAS